MGNKLHYIALQLAGRVSAALRGGFGGEGSEVELETGDWSCAVGVGVGVSGRGCGTCLSLYSTVVVAVVVVSFVGNARESKIGRDRRSQSLDGQIQTETLRPLCVAAAVASSQATKFQKRAKVGACDMQ